MIPRSSSERDSGEENKPFLDEHDPEQLRPKKSPTCRSFLPWLLTAVSWIITVSLLLSSAKDGAIECTIVQEPASQCPQHFQTDLAALQPVVEYELRQYTGELIYEAATNRIIRNLTGNETLYFGPPSQAIDDAWHELLRGEYPVLFPEEAAPYNPELIPIRIDNKYHFEPDVFHSLHCLNAVRMAIDKDYYGEEGKALHGHASIWPQEDWERIHMDHCLDQLRQALICHGDLAPVPLYSWKNVPLAIGRGHQHTCRKWEPIREWVHNRNKDNKPIEEW